MNEPILVITWPYLAAFLGCLAIAIPLMWMMTWIADKRKKDAIRRRVEKTFDPGWEDKFFKSYKDASRKHFK